jgi:hypothetical protein
MYRSTSTPALREGSPTPSNSSVADTPSHKSSLRSLFTFKQKGHLSPSPSQNSLHSRETTPPEKPEAAGSGSKFLTVGPRRFHWMGKNKSTEIYPSDVRGSQEEVQARPNAMLDEFFMPIDRNPFLTIRCLFFYSQLICVMSIWVSI